MFYPNMWKDFECWTFELRLLVLTLTLDKIYFYTLTAASLFFFWQKGWPVKLHLFHVITRKTSQEKKF